MIRLDDTYRSRAAPPGSARYWSWLFSHPEARAPLLGVFALLAEWRAATNPAVDAAVAQTKLLWWRDEMQRLAQRAPLHPISRLLGSLPGAAGIDFAPLAKAVGAAAAHVGGVPIERGALLPAHAQDLIGGPLLIAARLGADAAAASPGLRDCTAALAHGEYLARALADYRRDAGFGRIAFPIDELLERSIGNDDLCAPATAPGLAAYLAETRAAAARSFARAAAALEPPERARHRGLLVLAALGGHHLRTHRPPYAEDVRLQDIYFAWRTARTASCAR